MASVYHYCTMKTLNLILKGKELKFSDVRNSNDNEEIIKGLKAYIQYMYENIDEYKDLIIFYETFLKMEVKTKSYPCFCTSKNGDSTHMWSIYAPEGVAIEFDKEKLDVWKDKIVHVVNEAWSPDENKIPNFSYAVIADEIKYKTEEELYDYLKELKPNLRSEDSYYYIELLKFAYFLKAYFPWKNEEEYRLLIRNQGNKNETCLGITDEKNIVYKKIKYDTYGESKYVKKDNVFDHNYVEYDNNKKTISEKPMSTLEEIYEEDAENERNSESTGNIYCPSFILLDFNPDMIKSITLSPCIAANELYKEIMELLLRHYGFPNVEVKFSKLVKEDVEDYKNTYAYKAIKSNLEKFKYLLSLILI